MNDDAFSAGPALDSAAEYGAPAAPRRGVPRGCMVWGCVGSLLFIGLIGGGGGFLVCKIRAWLDEYSEPQPMELPVYKPAEGELAALDKRVEDYVAKARGDGGGELALTADDLNARIAGMKVAQKPADGDENGKKDKNVYLADVVHVRVEGERVFLDASIPLENFPIVGRPGRYLNGVAELDVHVRNGELFTTIESLRTTKGDEVPKEILKEMSAELNKTVDDEREGAGGEGESLLGEVIKNSKSMEVKDGQLIFRN